MVAQVRGEVDVDARRAYVVEEAVAGTAADGDGTDQLLRVPGDAQPGRGTRQAAGGARGEFGQRERDLQLADPAQPAAARRVSGVRYEGPGDPQPDGAGEGVGDSGVGAVGVGVRDVQGHIVLDQRVHDTALEAGGRDRRRTAQVQRMVGDQQVGADPYGLVGDLLHGVDGEQHPRDLRPGIAADQAHGIPLLGPVRGPEGFERGDDVGQ